MLFSSIPLYLNGPNTPAVFSLIPDAGKQGEAVVTGAFQHGVVRLADFGNAGDGVCPVPLFGGQRDPVPILQGVDFSKVVVSSPVVRRQGNVAVPNAGVGEMSCSLSPPTEVDVENVGGVVEAVPTGPGKDTALPPAVVLLPPAAAMREGLFNGPSAARFGVRNSPELGR